MKTIAFICVALAFFIGILGYRILMRDVDRQRYPYLPFSEPIQYLCDQKSFHELLGNNVVAGRAIPLDISHKCGEMLVPDNIATYIVRLADPTMTLLLDGRPLQGLDGLLASYGLDWDCDFDEDRLSVISYSPTNGLQSNGDIVCLFKKGR